eukprot:1105632-Heterocapsa_arctica.AAC.1
MATRCTAPHALAERAVQRRANHPRREKARQALRRVPACENLAAGREFATVKELSVGNASGLA